MENHENFILREIVDIISLIIRVIWFLSAAHQVSRSQSNDDEEDLRNHKRSLRNKISELLEDYKAEMD